MQQQVTIDGKVDWYDYFLLDYDTEQWIDACHSLNLKYGDKLKITISKTENYESK